MLFKLAILRHFLSSWCPPVTVLSCLFVYGVAEGHRGLLAPLQPGMELCQIRESESLWTTPLSDSESESLQKNCEFDKLL